MLETPPLPPRPLVLAQVSLAFLEDCEVDYAARLGGRAVWEG